MSHQATDSNFKRFFNFRRISDEAGVQMDKVYNNLRGRYTSLNDDERNKIARALIPQIERLFDLLGFECKFSRKAKAK